MSAAPPQETAVHGTALLIGETGVLLRGASGAGKSLLALDLIERTRGCGGFAALIGDDRVLLSAAHGRIVARPHPAIAGRIELRGAGIARLAEAAWEPAGVIRLVVDLLEAAEIARDRHPEEAGGRVFLCGAALPRLRLCGEAPAATGAILAYIHRLVVF